MIYIGDIHGKFEAYQEIIHGYENSVQIGDFGVGFQNDAALAVTLEAMGTKHRFFRGNHDNYIQCQQYPQFIEDGTIEGDTIYIGGAWSIDHAFRVEGVSWWRDEEVSNENWDRIYDSLENHWLARNRITKFVTHDCPFFLYKSEGFGYRKTLQSKTASFLEILFDEFKPDVWIFGHHHQSFRKKVDGCEFICLNELEVLDMGD